MPATYNLNVPPIQKPRHQISYCQHNTMRNTAPLNVQPLHLQYYIMDDHILPAIHARLIPNVQMLPVTYFPDYLIVHQVHKSIFAQCHDVLNQIRVQMYDVQRQIDEKYLCTCLHTGRPDLEKQIRYFLSLYNYIIPANIIVNKICLRTIY